MSSPRVNGNGTPAAPDSSNGSQVPANVQADITLLQSLLNDGGLSGDLDNIDESTIEELLQRLETADGIAQGVESRLDGIIDNLDGLLESLETQEGDTRSETQARTGEDDKVPAKEDMTVDEAQVEEVVVSQ